MTKPERKQSASLWLAVRLTHLPLESLGISRANKSMIISHKGRVCAATDNLSPLGITAGMPSSTAQLLVNVDDDTPCRTYEREPDSEQQALDQLCEELYNYTPHIETHRVSTQEGCEDIGLLLELSRCLTLFKGLMPLIEQLTDALKNTQLSYRLGQGHSKQMAWLLSYTQQTVVPHYTRDDFIAQLQALDLKHIYEYPAAVAQLKKTGFFTFADTTRHIEQASLHSLRKRCGEEFCDHLADIYGIGTGLAQVSLFTAPLATYRPQTIFSESLQFDYPVSNCEQLAHPITTLLGCLTGELVKNQAQTQTICWMLYDIYQNQASICVRLERLHRDSKLAIDLTMIQLQNQPLPFEVDVLELRCEKMFPVNFEHAAIDNDTNTAAEHHALATVTAKLHARLGDQAMFTLTPKDSHIPELSFAKTPIDNTRQKPVSATAPQPKADRPAWIFNIPVKLGRRQNDLYWRGKLELLQGPERIEGLWWLKPTARDYFVARRDDHVRLWVFHDLHKNEWFVHGVFA